MGVHKGEATVQRHRGCLKPGSVMPPQIRTRHGPRRAAPPPQEERIQVVTRTSILYSTICQSLHFPFWRPLVSGTWQCASSNVWKPLTLRNSPPELPSRHFVNLVNSVILPKRTSVSMQLRIKHFFPLAASKLW